MLDNKYFHLYSVFGFLVLSLLFVDSTFVYFLVVYMLFVPLIDRDWRKENLRLTINKSSLLTWVLCALSILLLARSDIQVWTSVLTIFLVAAIPEEWFFRGFLQFKLGNNYAAILISSLFFSIAHAITLSWLFGVLVFIPSILYGYIFKRTGDLIMVIMLHALSNLIYQMYVFKWIEPYVAL